MTDIKTTIDFMRRQVQSAGPDFSPIFHAMGVKVLLDEIDRLRKLVEDNDIEAVVSRARRYAMQASNIWRTFVPHAMGEFIELREFRAALATSEAGDGQPDTSNAAPDTKEMKAIGAFLAAMADSGLDGVRTRDAMAWVLRNDVAASLIQLMDESAQPDKKGGA